MKTFACTLVLLGAAALCGCTTNVSKPSSDAAPTVRATTTGLAGASWPQSVKAILAQAKTASGGAAWDHVHSLRSEGTIAVGGLKGHATSLEDLRTGRSVSRYTLGPIQGARGFDGKIGWRVSPGGEVSPTDTPAAQKREATVAYQTERAWWFPKRHPAAITLLGTKQDNGKTFRVLRIAPRGGNPFELWINAKTHLIARMVDRSRIRPETTYLGDYRKVGGIRIPFHQRSSNGKKQYDTVIQLTKVSVNVPVAASDFAMPKQKLHDFSFIGGGDRATIPFKLINNHIYIQVAVNGHPLQFIFDTGGANILTPAAASAAGIASKGALEGNGVGKKSVNTGLGKVKSLTLGGKVAIKNQTFGVMAMPGFGKVEGAKFDGLVGFEVFKRFVVKIDYAAHKLTFIRPSAFKAKDAGTAVPISFIYGRIPGVEGSIDGLSGLFEIDTGNRGSLDLFTPFAKAHNLYSRYQATPKAAVGWGVGGSVMGRIARGGKLMIGPIAVHDPVVELSTATKGATANKHVVGNIGGEILKRFTVTFDYADKRMYLKPNKDYGTPMNYDRSGMWVNGKDGDFIVKFVMQGGPAAEAGLKAGDVITAVNGKPASAIGLVKFREMLRDKAPGTKVKLTVGEGKAAHTVTVTLRRLIPKTGGLKKAA